MLIGTWEVQNSVVVLYDEYGNPDAHQSYKKGDKFINQSYIFNKEVKYKFTENILTIYGIDGLPIDSFKYQLIKDSIHCNNLLINIILISKDSINLLAANIPNDGDFFLTKSVSSSLKRIDFK
jgi:hypothetical protein